MKVRFNRWYNALMTVCLLAVVATGLTACNSDDEDDGSEYWTVTLDGYPTERTVYYLDQPHPYQVIRAIRDDGKEYYFNIGEIEGFEYEAGYMYQLLIKATPTLQQPGTCNPPPYQFKLVKIISKEYFNWCKTW